MSKKTIKSGENKENKQKKTLKIKSKKLLFKGLNNNNAMGLIPVKDYKDEYIKILHQLSYYNKVHEKQPIKAKVYENAIEKIKSLNEPLTSINDIIDTTNNQYIASHFKKDSAVVKKLDEFIKTNKVNNLEQLKEKYGTEPYTNYKILEDKKAVFTKIHGIGDKAAEKFIEMGITTIEELKSRKDELVPGKGKKDLKLLNETQQKGLIYYEQILERIPREEIEEYKILLNKYFLEAIKELNKEEDDNQFEIVGSYRRGKKESGDIDIIITSKSNNKDVFDKFLDILKEKDLIQVFLSKGEKKSMVIAKLSNTSTARRLDFLYSPPEEYAFAVLYFTGSKEFNTAMRQHALSQELTLNEHGFHKMEKNVKGAKITDHIFNSEKDIFDYLNMEYKEPNERIDKSSVIIKTTLNTTNKEETKPKEEAQVKEEKPKEKPKNITLKNKNNTEKDINNFKKEGINYLKSLSEAELTKILKEANQSYYQDNEDKELLLNDNEYDVIREYVLKTYPNNKTAKNQHADTEIKITKNKVKLPYEMWSMDKIKPNTNELNKYKEKYNGPYVISCKLDGISALYSTEEKEPHLYTRGDGKYGQLINHLIPYLNLPKTKNIVLRGELIIKEETFKTKYLSTYSNSRNFIAGIVNKKKLSNSDIEALKDIDLVAYELIKPIKKPSEQLEELTKLETITVKHIPNITKEQLTNEFLSQKLLDYRKDYMYSIDGIICCDDNIYERTSKNPEHAFAFKMVLSDQVVEAKVLDVLWAPSKDGLLKPRVQIEPVTIGGATIEYATGFNANFIEINKIGVGAIIRLIRSGDVIPHIEEVVTSASMPLMPTEEYEWNETHVDIILKNKEDNEIVLQKNITGFFKALDVEGLGEGNIKKIIKIGANSISKILALSIDELKTVEGFKDKMATKIYNSISDKINKASIGKIAASCNIFGRGFGEKRIELILIQEPDILTNNKLSENEKVEKIEKINGLAKKTATQFVESIPDFMKFIKEAKLENKLNTEIKSNSKSKSKSNPTQEQEDKQDKPLYNKIIVLSDFKSSSITKKEFTNKIIELGGSVEDNITKKTNILINGNPSKESTKVKKAKTQPETKILTIEEFTKLYL